MRSVIYIKYSPLTKKVYDDYCMGPLLSKGFRVEYWDITALYDFDLHDLESYTPNNKLIIRKILSYKEFEQYARSYKESLFILLMTCRLNQFKLLSIFTNLNIKIAFWGPAPLYMVQNSMRSRLKNISFVKIKKRLEESIMHIFLRMGIIKYYNYYFNVGQYGYKSLGIVDCKLLLKTKAFQVSSFDYNSFRYPDHQCVVNDNDYIVFIDQYFPFHPDAQITGGKTIPANIYYTALNSFFTIIEEKTKKKVIVAAHPKALKYRSENYFQGRPVLFNQTCTLVKNAHMVLAHTSTSVYYAIMALKPILLLNTALFKEYTPLHDLLVTSLAERFNLDIVNIDNCYNTSICPLSYHLSDNQYRLYTSFIYEYCTSPSIHQSNETLIATYIQSIFAE